MGAVLYYIGDPQRDHNLDNYPGTNCGYKTLAFIWVSHRKPVSREMLLLRTSTDYSEL